MGRCLLLIALHTHTHTSMLMGTLAFSHILVSTFMLTLTRSLSHLDPLVGTYEPQLL